MLRNTLTHQKSASIDKADFDKYIQLTKDAFVALGQSTTRVDGIEKLGEEDVPVLWPQQHITESTEEQLKQMEDKLDQIESRMTDDRSDIKDIKSGVTGVMRTMIIIFFLNIAVAICMAIIFQLTAVLGYLFLLAFCIAAMCEAAGP